MNKQQVTNAALGPQSAWERLLEAICECRAFIGSWPGETATLTSPGTHEDFCPAAQVEAMHDEIRAQFLAEAAARSA